MCKIALKKKTYCVKKVSVSLYWKELFVELMFILERRTIFKGLRLNIQVTEVCICNL